MNDKIQFMKVNYSPINEMQKHTEYITKNKQKTITQGERKF